MFIQNGLLRAYRAKLDAEKEDAEKECGKRTLESDDQDESDEGELPPTPLENQIFFQQEMAYYPYVLNIHESAFPISAKFKVRSNHSEKPEEEVLALVKQKRRKLETDRREFDENRLALMSDVNSACRLAEMQWLVVKDHVDDLYLFHGDMFKLQRLQVSPNEFELWERRKRYKKFMVFPWYTPPMPDVELRLLAPLVRTSKKTLRAAVRTLQAAVRRRAVPRSQSTTLHNTP